MSGKIKFALLSLFFLILTSTGLHSQEMLLPQKIANGYNEFGFGLYDQILADNTNGNIFISPASAAMVLSMTCEGASGETRTQMADVLGLSAIDEKSWDKAFKDLFDRLQPGKAELNIANSIWLSKSLDVKDSFVNGAKNKFKAQIETLTSADAINQWVSRQTREKIKNIIDDLSPRDMAVLVNAIYFKGMWALPFEKEATEEKDFHLLNGSTVQHPLMTREDHYNYYGDDNIQAIRLPYADCSISMFVFLPSADMPFKDFAGRFNYDEFRDIRNKMTRREGTITLPKFKIEYGEELNKALLAMGMADAFDPGKADFTGISSMPLFISKVKQKTFIEVNEEGTEAAAATSVTMRLTAAAPEPVTKFEMVVDRPFFCAILDERTNLVLFMGSIVDPG